MVFKMQRRIKNLEKETAQMRTRLSNLEQNVADLRQYIGELRESFQDWVDTEIRKGFSKR